MPFLPYNPSTYKYVEVWAVTVSLAATKVIARTFFLTIMAQPKLYLIRKKVPFIAFFSSRY